MAFSKDYLTTDYYRTGEDFYPVPTPNSGLSYPHLESTYDSPYGSPSAQDGTSHIPSMHRSSQETGTCYGTTVPSMTSYTPFDHFSGPSVPTYEPSGPPLQFGTFSPSPDCQNGQNNEDTLGQPSPLTDDRHENALPDHDSQPKQTYPCLFPGCNGKPFSRSADLDRHYKMMHVEREERPKWHCDYRKCNRHETPFYRQDHFRDHLSDFHKEDLFRRTKRSDQKWWESRSPHALYRGWWRCNRCLVKRVNIESDEYTCPDCGNPCEPERVRARQVDGPASAYLTLDLEASFLGVHIMEGRMFMAGSLVAVCGLAQVL